MFQFNDNRKDHKQVQLSEKQLNEIGRRQKLAIMLNAREKIEDYKNEVFGIIENDGLKHENEKTRLDTALKTLEYIIPKKKSSEVTITTRKIEDIIQESIQEAEIIEIKDNKPDDNSNNKDNKQGE